MVNRFKKYLDKIFLFCNKTPEVMEFKEELLGVLMDKYEELREANVDEEEAYRICIASIDDYKDTIKELEKIQPVEMTVSQIKLVTLASLVFLFATLIIYFTVSYLTKAWDTTWITFILALVIYLIAIFVGVYVIAKHHSRYSVVRSTLFILFLLVTTLIYLSVSFATNAWVYTWVCYMAGALLWYLADIAYRIRHKVKRFTNIDIIVITSLVTLTVYFITSFVTMLWQYTWVIFLIGTMVALIMAFIRGLIDYKNKIGK